MAPSSGIECDPIQGLNVSSAPAFPTAIYPRRIFEPTFGISPLKRLWPAVQLELPSCRPLIVGRTDPLFQSKRSLHLAESCGVAKIENKIVTVPAGVRFPVNFESIVRCKTHNALISPGRCKNILALHERK